MIEATEGDISGTYIFIRRRRRRIKARWAEIYIMHTGLLSDVCLKLFGGGNPSATMKMLRMKNRNRNINEQSNGSGGNQTDSKRTPRLLTCIFHWRALVRMGHNGWNPHPTNGS